MREKPQIHFVLSHVTKALRIFSESFFIRALLGCFSFLFRAFVSNPYQLEVSAYIFDRLR